MFEVIDAVCVIILWGGIVVSSLNRVAIITVRKNLVRLRHNSLNALTIEKNLM